MTEPVKFDVLQDILASDTRAAILDELATRVKSTGRVIESPFAIILTVSGAEITHLQMLENNFAVSKATKVRPALSVICTRTRFPHAPVLRGHGVSAEQRFSYSFQ